MGVVSRNEALDPHPNLPPASQRGKEPDRALEPSKLHDKTHVRKSSPCRRTEIPCLSMYCHAYIGMNDPQFFRRSQDTHQEAYTVRANIVLDDELVATAMARIGGQDQTRGRRPGAARAGCPPSTTRAQRVGWPQAHRSRLRRAEGAPRHGTWCRLTPRSGSTGCE
jgi:hypothetical protein